jgi:hypothetical protein
MPGSWDDAPTCDLCSIEIVGTALEFHVPHECRPATLSKLGSILRMICPEGKVLLVADTICTRIIGSGMLLINLGSLALVIVHVDMLNEQQSMEITAHSPMVWAA